MVKEARREFSSKHLSNFTTDGNCDLSRTFKWLAASANLLGTSIHKIQASWTGPKELKQVSYALQSLPKGLKFLHAVPPQNLLRSWDWWVYTSQMSFSPDALQCFGGVTYCPWCRKEGENEGTEVNHLQTMHYRLGLVCNRCYDCPSTTSDTFHHHGWHDCCQLRENVPSKSVPSESFQGEHNCLS